MALFFVEPDREEARDVRYVGRARVQQVAHVEERLRLDPKHVHEGALDVGRERVLARTRPVVVVHGERT
jgi:hypothetical protein